MNAKTTQIFQIFIRWVFLLFVLCIGTTVSNASESEDVSDAPQKVVENLQTTLLQAMREGEQFDFQARFEYLAPAIDQSHDVDMIIKTILGATIWFDLEEEQQSLIIDTFRELSIATYAERFTQYNNEQFEVVEQRELPRNQILVRSKLTKGNGEMVSFDYVLQQTDGAWRIVNILFDGVSDLAIKRSEYRSVLQQEGFFALIAMLQEKIMLSKQGQ